MGTVKTAFEKAMEKVGEIEALTAEEKEALKERDRLKLLLADFYKGDLSRDALWQKLRGMKPALLSEAQHQMLATIRLGSSEEEMHQRRNGIVAIESLKEERNVPVVESGLNVLAKLQKEYSQGKAQAFEELRAAVEQNPQLRMRPVKTPDGRTVLQPARSVDEAVQAKIADFLAVHEKRYEEVFAQGVERLRKELR